MQCLDTEITLKSQQTTMYVPTYLELWKRICSGAAAILGISAGFLLRCTFVCNANYVTVYVGKSASEVVIRTEGPGSNPGKVQGFLGHKHSNAVVYNDFMCVVCLVCGKK
jgi:hypothetical protein